MFNEVRTVYEEGYMNRTSVYTSGVGSFVTAVRCTWRSEELDTVDFDYNDIVKKVENTISDDRRENVLFFYILGILGNNRYCETIKKNRGELFNIKEEVCWQSESTCCSTTTTDLTRSMSRSNCWTPLDEMFWTTPVFLRPGAFRLPSVHFPKEAHGRKKMLNPARRWWQSFTKQASKN